MPGRLIQFLLDLVIGQLISHVTNRGRVSDNNNISQYLGTHFLYLSNPPSGNLLPIIPCPQLCLGCCCAISRHQHFFSVLPARTARWPGDQNTSNLSDSIFASLNSAKLSVTLRGTGPELWRQPTRRAAQLLRTLANKIFLDNKIFFAKDIISVFKHLVLELRKYFWQKQVVSKISIYHPPPSITSALSLPSNVKWNYNIFRFN